jgi:hypothetical protein
VETGLRQADACLSLARQKEDPQLQTSHDFLLITLANGTQFCIDMTGSQFGIWGWLMKKGGSGWKRNTITDLLYEAIRSLDQSDRSSMMK